MTGKNVQKKEFGPMKKGIVLLLIVLSLLLCLAGCEKDHEWGDWEVTIEPTCTQKGLKTRTCEECGEEESKYLDKVAHEEVMDEEVPATCTQYGSMGGSHCRICGEKIKESTPLQKKEHSYTQETVVNEATCQTAGLLRMDCEHCDAYLMQDYDMAQYSATEINKMALEYVGEIKIYDKNGEGLSLGTGFVYSADGKIITNYHVIDGAYTADITINGKTYEIQKILAYDAEIDLAVVQIDATDLPTAKICTEPMEVGSTIFAIGSSRGLTNTFSQGIIPYYDREMEGVHYLQHDASITNGNSGGPVVNTYGEVVAVNTMVVRESQNLNFAVLLRELDNLDFSAPVTVKEFYEALNPTLTPEEAYVILGKWVIANNTFVDDSEYRYDEEYGKGWYSAGYNREGDYVYADLLYTFDSGAELYVILDFSYNEKNYYYYACYTAADGTSNEVYGYINAYEFTKNTPLTYEETRGGNWDMNVLLEQYQMGVAQTLTWLNLVMQNYMGIAIADLGFTQF